MNKSKAGPGVDPLMASRLGLGARAGRRRLWLWAGAALIVVAAGAGYYLSRPPARAYVTQPITWGTLDVTVSATGTLAPRDQVDVGAEVSGRIDKLEVDFNDHVRKGQVLALINTDQYWRNSGRPEQSRHRPRRPCVR